MNRIAAQASPVTPGVPLRCDAPGPLDAAHTPFIALTEGEVGLDTDELEPEPGGWIDYRNPGPYDRYPDTEFLLARTVSTVPSGRPVATVLCPYRQAHCILNRRCQGCGAPAARSEHGILYVLPARRRDGSPAAFSGLSDMPPSCARCAFHFCPVLADRGRNLQWVKQSELVAVYGTVFLPPGAGGLRMLPEQQVLIQDEQTLSATVVTRLVCDLQKVSKADPGHLLALARQPRPAPAEACAQGDAPSSSGGPSTVRGRTS
ncbi:hypothetical protein [Streptomyces anulatus]|uniref:hypothetical protein n=1 Tax=Streptomyces anulatus TaxID=1892 RepID=UPI001C2721D5|nr:hypothetical protein [Streptomyces anulatus]